LSATEPSSVGTRTVAPSAASANVTGRVNVRSSPRRPKSAVLADVNRDVQVAGRPPRSPGVPLPAMRSLAPSLIPAGTRTVMVRVCWVTPLPPHSGHGVSMICPVPWQSRQGSEKPNAP
jgi:hypothetical protein